MVECMHTLSTPTLSVQTLFPIKSHQDKLYIFLYVYLGSTTAMESLVLDGPKLSSNTKRRL